MDVDGSGSERRREERVPAKIEIRFQSSEQAARAIKAYSINFSIGGLCLKTQKSYSIGHELHLSMEINGDQFAVRAVVAWVRGGNVGVRFVDVSPEDRAKLGEMVASLQKG